MTLAALSIVVFGLTLILAVGWLYTADKRDEARKQWWMDDY